MSDADIHIMSLFYCLSLPPAMSHLWVLELREFLSGSWYSCPPLSIAVVLSLWSFRFLPNWHKVHKVNDIRSQIRILCSNILPLCHIVKIFGLPLLLLEPLNSTKLRVVSHCIFESGERVHSTFYRIPCIYKQETGSYFLQFIALLISYDVGLCLSPNAIFCPSFNICTISNAQYIAIAIYIW